MIIVTTIVLLILGWLLVRRMKHHRTSANYYRPISSAVKRPVIRPNRYQKKWIHKLDPKYKKHTENNVSEAKETSSNDLEMIFRLEHSEKLAKNHEKVVSHRESTQVKPLAPIVFHIMAEKGQYFRGYELLQAILSVHMRYGQHHIFHRYQQKTGEGLILFSLASVLKPGLFDLSKMGAFSTPGLSLFFSVMKVDDPIAVYELMLQTVGELVEDLGGCVLDEQHQLLTPATVMYQRRLLREYITSQQVPDLFETPLESD